MLTQQQNLALPPQPSGIFLQLPINGLAVLLLFHLLIVGAHTSTHRVLNIRNPLGVKPPDDWCVSGRDPRRATNQSIRQFAAGDESYASGRFVQASGSGSDTLIRSISWRFFVEFERWVDLATLIEIEGSRGCPGEGSRVESESVRSIAQAQVVGSQNERFGYRFASATQSNRDT